MKVKTTASGFYTAWIFQAESKQQAKLLEDIRLAIERMNDSVRNPSFRASQLSARRILITSC